MSGMKNINFKYLYRRTEQLLMVPETVWPEALNETNSGKELYRNYLIPITMVISIMVLLINLINYNFWQATGLTIINMISDYTGIFVPETLFRYEPGLKSDRIQWSDFHYFS